MQYTILINQAGVADAGLSDDTDMMDWAILGYVHSWITHPKAVRRGDAVWINYRHLINSLPLLGIKSKGPLAKRFTRLQELGLIWTERDEDGRKYVGLTEKYHNAHSFRQTDATVSPEKHPVSDGKHPVSPEKHSVDNHSLGNQEVETFAPANAEASAEPSQKKPDRPRDPIWDTLMEVCGIETTAIPKSARGAYNRAVKELREVGATPEQIRNRAARWHKVYSGATLTPTALVKHWASLAGSKPRQQTEGRIPV